MRNTDISPEATDSSLRVFDLGWSSEEAKETLARLAALAEKWEAPGMEAYDHL